MMKRLNSLTITIRACAGVLAFGLGMSSVWASPADALEGSGTATPAAVSNIDALEGGGVQEKSVLPGGADALEGSGAPAALTAAQPDDGVRCEGQGPCLELSTQLPLRVLPRSFSSMYSASEVTDDTLVQANLPAFKPLYVFDRQGVDLSDPVAPRGWYQVGSGKDKAEGWMQAADLLEWRQALMLSYTHPGNPLEGRRPVLMFRDKASLDAVVDDFDMAGSAAALYKQIDGGEVPDGVVSMEPKRFVDITQNFYLLPILQWSQTQIDGDDARLLQLAAAVPRGRGADSLDNAEYRTQAAVSRNDGGTIMGDVKADIVFVVDTTRSMQPFIDMTRDAVAKMASNLSGELAERVRFGLVVFRDSLEVAPQLEYVTRNLTPELVDAPALATLLDEKGGATEVGSVDYAEEAFAGVEAALASKWRKDALRFVILLGDASSHPKGHKQNTTGKDETDLRREYDDQQVHLLAIHLKDPRAEEDHERAAAQFAHLSRVRGTQNDSAMESVDAFDPNDYRNLAERVAQGIASKLKVTMGAGEAAGGNDEAAAFADAAAVPASLNKVWDAALIEYIGKEANPPKDVVAWALDRDLVNPADRSMDVRVLVTRSQLSSLAQSLDQVVQALMRAEVTQMQFFEALQGVAGQAMKRPDEMDGAARLAESGLLPAFIQSLPYRSDILALNDEMFASMTAEQRSKLEWSILAKLDQYRAINEQVDAWFRLNDMDTDQELVYPLHLDYLP